MTRVNITIQDGKVTWIEQKGEEIPNPTWDEIVASVTNLIDKEARYDTRTISRTIH